jgi:hypothetical protein
MKMNKSELSYYTRIYDSLIGKLISNIFYEELDYQDSLEHWKFSDDVHSVDMNVILQLSDKSIIQLQWDHEFYSYGIGCKPLVIIENRENIKTVSISEKPWMAFLNSPIKDIIVYWSESESLTQEYENYKLVNIIPETIKLPQTWELQFEDNASIYLTAMEILPERISYWADHLTVLFNNADVKKYLLDKDLKISVRDAILGKC